MRIRTGIMQLTATFNRKCFIKYKCAKCGREHLAEYDIKINESEMYQKSGGEAARQKAENNMSERALEKINKIDVELFESINVRCDYEKISKAVVCPDCKEKQPWSKIPCTWRNVQLFRLWVVVLVCFSIMSLIIFFSCLSGSDFQPVFLVITYLLAFSALPFIRKIRRKKALDRMHTKNFEPPTYYNATNVEELKAGEI